jgi:hypothetical protein
MYPLVVLNALSGRKAYARCFGGRRFPLWGNAFRSWSQNPRRTARAAGRRYGRAIAFRVEPS